MARAPRNADHASVDVPRPVQLGMAVVDRQRRGAVFEPVRLDRDERHAPLAIEAHCQAADLEGVVGRELVTDLRVERVEIGAAVPVDERSLPGEEARPGGVRRKAGATVRTPTRPELLAEGAQGVLVEADRRIEADHPQ